jgi:hypothetical protein
MHNEELNNLYFSPSIIRLIVSRRMRFCGTCRTNEEKYRILLGKPERKRPLGILRCRLVDNIKMDFRER